MAHFARHTEMLGRAQANLLPQHSAPHSRSCRQGLYGERTYTHTHVQYVPVCDDTVANILC